MSEERKLIRCRVRMTETRAERTAYVLADGWQRLDDWAAESRCEILSTELLACTSWPDNTLTGVLGEI